MSFKVIKAGFHSAIQDGGRFGYAHLGLNQSGVIDEHAYRWANHLLGNQQNDAVLEITFGNCELEALADTTCVVTGAELQFQINGKKQANWQTISVKQNDKLIWKTPQIGVRAYLAIKGGFQTHVFLGSRSNSVREHIGALIRQDDELPFISSSLETHKKSIPSWFKQDYSVPLTLRLLPSYQFDDFSPQQRDILFNQTYKVGQASDRTGYRLEGKIIHNTTSTMTSEGIAFGSVEITTAGLPIILLNDAPTIGGYPKIGTVFSLDLAKLAQRQPGSGVRFELIAIEAAQQLRREFNQFFV